MKIWKQGGITVFPVALALLSCAPDAPAWQGSVQTVDGVIRIENPEEPLFGERVLDLEEDLVIAGDPEDEARMFQDIVALDVDADGTLYVLDEQAGNIKVFDRRGLYRRTIGRKGQGPGELSIPISVVVTPGGEVLINDLGNRKLVFLSPAGDYIKQMSIADKFMFMGPRFLSDGRIVGSYIVPGPVAVSELHVFDSGLQSLNVLTSVEVGKPPRLNYFVGMQLTSLMWNVIGGDAIVWGDILKPEYELFVCSGEGKLERSIAREYDRLRISAAERTALLARMFGNNPEAQSQWEIVFPEFYPPFSGVSFDDEGRLYVKTYDGDEGGAAAFYDVFDSEGRYIARILFEWPPMIMRNGFLYTIVEGADGFKSVMRCRMSWQF
jgi:hypothetical protein